jgi:hypothetical protein
MEGDPWDNKDCCTAMSYWKGTHHQESISIVDNNGAWVSLQGWVHICCKEQCFRIEWTDEKIPCACQLKQQCILQCHWIPPTSKIAEQAKQQQLDGRYLIVVWPGATPLFKTAVHSNLPCKLEESTLWEIELHPKPMLKQFVLENKIILNIHFECIESVGGTTTRGPSLVSFHA